MWKLKAALKCRSCKKGRYAPPVHMIKLTATQEITPYKWVHSSRQTNRVSLSPGGSPRYGVADLGAVALMKFWNLGSLVNIPPTDPRSSSSVWVFISSLR
jgi:hypothetical protein